LLYKHGLFNGDVDMYLSTTAIYTFSGVNVALGDIFRHRWLRYCWRNHL